MISLKKERERKEIEGVMKADGSKYFNFRISPLNLGLKQKKMLGFSPYLG